MKFPLVANCKLVPTSKLVNSSLVLAQTEFLEALKQVHEAASEVTASVRGSVSKSCRKVPSFPHLESLEQVMDSSSAQIQNWQHHKHGYKIQGPDITFSFLQKEDWISEVNKWRGLGVMNQHLTHWNHSSPLPPVFLSCYSPVTKAQTQTTIKCLTTGYSGCKDGKVFSCKIFPL